MATPTAPAASQNLLLMHSPVIVTIAHFLARPKARLYRNFHACPCSPVTTSPRLSPRIGQFPQYPAPRGRPMTQERLILPLRRDNRSVCCRRNPLIVNRKSIPEA
jgi:hypothetical protein